MMKILYIYRHPDMGFSIGKVFKPIEEEMRKYAEVDSIYMPVPNYSLRGLWLNIRAARRAVRAKHYDVVHITGAEYYLIPFLKSSRIVVTVHDLGFFTNHKKGLRAINKYLLWIRTLSLADYVTFISQKSEAEAMRLVTLRSGAHSVVHNPVGPEYQPCPKNINTHKPTILQVGTKPNKNLDTTIKALCGYPCKLRIVGELTDAQGALLSECNIDYENVWNLTDDEVLNEYKDCDYVNFPSFYEGFGMPIIEGQGVGRPVLTSNRSPMQDIAGNAAVIVDPSDPKSIREGYEKMPELADELVRKGLENVKSFRVDYIARKYYDVYKTVQK